MNIRKKEGLPWSQQSLILDISLTSDAERDIPGLRQTKQLSFRLTYKLLQQLLKSFSTLCASLVVLGQQLPLGSSLNTSYLRRVLKTKKI